MNSETPLVLQTTAGFSVFYQSRELYGKYPKTDSDRKAALIPLEDETLYLLHSPLLWYGVELIARRLPLHSHLFIFETDPNLFQLVNWIEAAQTVRGLPRIHVAMATNPHLIQGAFVSAISNDIRRIRSISLNASRLTNPKSHAYWERVFSDELRRFWRNRSTSIYLGLRWTLNLFHNLSLVTRASDISEISRHENVVVCGAGSSLESSINALIANREKLFIVCVDTALCALRSHGINPDLIVALDGQLANVHDFLSDGGHLGMVAADLSIHPSLFHACSFDRIFVFSSRYAPGKHWEKLTSRNILPSVIPPLGSVGVLALYLCVFFAESRVFFTGLDFSWPPGLTHARGSPQHVSRLSENNRLSGILETSSFSESATVSTPKGKGLMYSDPVLLGYRDSLNEVIEYLADEGITVFDIRERGLPLKAEIIPAEEFNALINCPTEIKKIGRSHIVDFKKRIRREDECFSLYTEFVSSLNQLEIHIREYIGSQPDSTQGERLMSDLGDHDFIFLDFPDRDWPNLKTGNLARALVRTIQFRRFIQRRLSLIN